MGGGWNDRGGITCTIGDEQGDKHRLELGRLVACSHITLLLGRWSEISSREI